MPMNPDGSVTIEVSADPQAVWAAVSDVTRHPEWSAECVAAEWADGTTAPAVGARFTGHNAVGDFTWDAPGLVTELEPGRSFAYQIGADEAPSAIWRWDIEVTEGGTRVTHSFHAPDLLKPDYAFPGRDEMLRAGIETTLERLKTVVEGE